MFILESFEVIEGGIESRINIGYRELAHELIIDHEDLLSWASLAVRIACPYFFNS